MDLDPDAPDNIMVRQLDRIANDLERLLSGTRVCAILLGLIVLELAIRITMEFYK